MWLSGIRELVFARPWLPSLGLPSPQNKTSQTYGHSDTVGGRACSSDRPKVSYQVPLHRSLQNTCPWQAHKGGDPGCSLAAVTLGPMDRPDLSTTGPTVVLQGPLGGLVTVAASGPPEHFPLNSGGIYGASRPPKMSPAIRLTGHPRPASLGFRHTLSGLWFRVIILYLNAPRCLRLLLELLPPADTLSRSPPTQLCGSSSSHSGSHEGRVGDPAPGAMPALCCRGEGGCSHPQLFVHRCTGTQLLSLSVIPHSDTLWLLRVLFSISDLLPRGSQGRDSLNLP